jgi:hypothetical protein
MFKMMDQSRHKRSRDASWGMSGKRESSRSRHYRAAVVMSRPEISARKPPPQVIVGGSCVTATNSRGNSPACRLTPQKALSVLRGTRTLAAAGHR